MPEISDVSGDWATACLPGARDFVSQKLPSLVLGVSDENGFFFLTCLPCLFFALSLPPPLRRSHSFAQ